MSETLLDIISQQFSKSKNSLSDELGKHLYLFDLTDEYQNEIKNIFNTKFRLIFDMEKDANSFLDFVTKVYGKSNIASYHYIEFEKMEENNDSESGSDGEEGQDTTSKQLIYLDGKLDLFNKIFEFKKNNLFTYGNYENMNKKQYCFTSFKSQNSNLLVKVEECCAYGVFNSHGKTDAIFKINKDFFKNPVIEMSPGLRIDDDCQNINEDNVGNIFNTLKTQKGYVKELKIYQIDN